MTDTLLRYDFRNPEFATTTRSAQYAACLEQCAWGERRGVTQAVLSEHHGLPDGYLPAPLTMAGAIAGRTTSLRITIAALLAPLHDPISLAEQLAVLDLSSGGRVRTVAGLGYRDEEFEMFGVPRSNRGKRTEEHLRVIRDAWRGEEFNHRGSTVRVTPGPASPPHELLLVGGSSEVAARRAARLGMGFFPAIPDAPLANIYRDECATQGFDDAFVVFPPTMGFVHVTQDPERDWERIAPYAVYEAVSYSSAKPPQERSAMEVDGETLQAIKDSGVYHVVTPQECLALAERLGPDGQLVLHPLMGGMPPELGWESLEVFASEVAPHLPG